MGTKTMSNMSQYTEIRPRICDGIRVGYIVSLVVGHKGFDIYPARDTLDEAEWMQEQLTRALERIVKERKGEERKGERG